MEIPYTNGRRLVSRHCERSEAIQNGAAGWIASALALQRFGGLEPDEACAASEEGSSLALLAMTWLAPKLDASQITPQ